MQNYYLQIDYLNIAKQFFEGLQLFQQFGLLGVFFSYMIPPIFFGIAEGVVLAAVLSGLPPISIILFAGIGGTLGDFLWYALGYYSYRKIKKNDTKKFQRIESKFKKLIFLYAAFPGGEILMAYAGVKHFHIKDIAPFVFASNVIIVSLTIAVILGIINFLPEIIKQIIF